MMPFDKCPICGGELAEKEVEKLLRGGDHTAVLQVHLTAKRGEGEAEGDWGVGCGLRVAGCELRVASCGKIPFFKRGYMMQD